jgi:hypothetical protein
MKENMKSFYFQSNNCINLLLFHWTYISFWIDPEPIHELIVNEAQCGMRLAKWTFWAFKSTRIWKGYLLLIVTRFFSKLQVLLCSRLPSIQLRPTLDQKESKKLRNIINIEIPTIFELQLKYSEAEIISFLLWGFPPSGFTSCFLTKM